MRFVSVPPNALYSAIGIRVLIEHLIAKARLQIVSFLETRIGLLATDSSSGCRVAGLQSDISDAKGRYRLGAGPITPQHSYLDQGGTTPLVRAYAIDCPRCSCWSSRISISAPCFVMSLPNSFTGACRSLSESSVIAFCRLTYEDFRASCSFSGSVTGAGFAPVFGAPESTPASMPFSLMIRLNTSPTERTPSPGFQSYLPA